MGGRGGVKDSKKGRHDQGERVSEGKTATAHRAKRADRDHFTRSSSTHKISPTTPIHSPPPPPGPSTLPLKQTPDKALGRNGPVLDHSLAGNWRKTPLSDPKYCHLSVGSLAKLSIITCKRRRCVRASVSMIVSGGKTKPNGMMRDVDQQGEWNEQDQDRSGNQVIADAPQPMPTSIATK